MPEPSFGTHGRQFIFIETRSGGKAADVGTHPNRNMCHTSSAGQEKLQRPSNFKKYNWANRHLANEWQRKICHMRERPWDIEGNHAPKYWGRLSHWDFQTHWMTASLLHPDLQARRMTIIIPHLDLQAHWMTAVLLHLDLQAHWMTNRFATFGFANPLNDNRLPTFGSTNHLNDSCFITFGFASQFEWHPFYYICNG